MEDKLKLVPDATTEIGSDLTRHDMRWLIVSVGLCALGWSTSLAQEKSPPKPAPEPLEKLVERLGARDYKTREAASKALEAHGFDSLPAMRKALETATSAEVRKRLSIMVQNLERAEVLSPKRLTLKFVDQPIAEVVKEIKKQTGYPILNQSGNNPKITIEMENATFWEVMDRLCLVAGLTVHHNEPQGMVLQYNDYFTPCVSYRGPFKIVGNNFNYNKTVNFGPLPRNPANNQMRSESLTFSFTLSTEPKLPIMSVSQPKVLEAVDEKGVSMVVPQSSHESMYHSYSGYRQFQSGSSVNLQWPNKETRMVKRLRISLPVTFLASQKPEITVEDPMKVKGKKFTGPHSELQIDEVKETNNKTQFQVKLTARNTGAGAAQDYTWANSVPQRIDLLDAKGRKFFQQGYNYENSSPGHMQATFMFGTNGDATIGPPVRLVFNHWETMQHTVEFEFKDLQLP
jgi:hypothetical protein